MFNIKFNFHDIVFHLQKIPDNIPELTAWELNAIDSFKENYWE